MPARRRETFGRVLAFVISLLCASSAKTEVPEAVLLLDHEAASGAAGRIVEVIRAQMMRIYRVVPGENAVVLAQREPACETGAGLARVLEGVRSGSDLFFERTDLDGSMKTLEEAVFNFFERPCVVRGEEAALREVCAGAALLLRLRLLRGRTREAEALAFRIATTFPAGMVEETHEPPEVLALIASARQKGLKTVLSVTPANRATGARLLVNGMSGEGEGPWQVYLAPGAHHELTVMTATGAVYVWRGSPRGQDIHLDLTLADRLVVGPKEAVKLTDGRDSPTEGASVAKLLAQVTGRTVLYAHGENDGWIIVEEVIPGRETARELLRLKPRADIGLGIDVVVDPAGPLLYRPTWPWPYIAAGAAAGLLGAGIYLNVAANRDADAVNRGYSNRVQEYWTHRRWSIVCYALAGASGASAVLLALLRPQLRDRFVVYGTPDEGGGFVSVLGGF